MVGRLLIVGIAVALLVSAMSYYYVAGYYATIPNQFSIYVIPDRTIDAFVGQQCVFLISVKDDESLLQGRGGYGEPVSISVRVNENVASIKVYPKTVMPGQITEVTVVPEAACTNSILVIAVSGERGGLKQVKLITIKVNQCSEDEKRAEAYATDVRNEFIPWIARNNPELNITSETTWTGTNVGSRTSTTVCYIFFSSEWELGISWCTTDPHNRTRIYLRQRYVESKPSLAFELTSLNTEYCQIRSINTKNALAEKYGANIHGKLPQITLRS